MACTVILHGLSCNWQRRVPAKAPPVAHRSFTVKPQKDLSHKPINLLIFFIKYFIFGYL
jgi:hypothetical protein